MERNCCRCHLTYDDEEGIDMCPHLIVESAPGFTRMNTFSAVNELMAYELDDLRENFYWEQGMRTITVSEES